MTNNSTTSSCHIARRVGHQGARPPVECQAGIQKNATGLNISKDRRLFKCKKGWKGWVMITSSAEKATNSSTIRGVGLLLRPKAHKALNLVETINPRTLIATFNGNPAVTVILYYSHTNVSNVDDREEFYAELSELTKAVPNDTGLSTAKLKSTMGNRKEWMKLVNGVRVRSK